MFQTAKITFTFINFAKDYFDIIQTQKIELNRNYKGFDLQRVDYDNIV